MEIESLKEIVREIMTENQMVRDEYTNMIRKEYADAQKIIGILSLLIIENGEDINSIVEMIVNDKCWIQKKDYQDIYKRINRFIKIIENMRELKEIL